MSDNGDQDLLARAEMLNKAMREMSDLLTGAVRTMQAEGWTEEQARSLVVAAFLMNVR